MKESMSMIGVFTIRSLIIMRKFALENFTILKNKSCIEKWCNLLKKILEKNMTSVLWNCLENQVKLHKPKLKIIVVIFVQNLSPKHTKQQDYWINQKLVLGIGHLTLQSVVVLF